MSIKALSWVLEHSEATLGSRLVLIALADFAHDDGTMAFPAVETLAKHARLTRRATQAALRKLEAEGHVEVTGVTRYGTTAYTIRGVDSSPPSDGGGVVDDRGGVVDDQNVSRTTPDPSPVIEPLVEVETPFDDDADRVRRHLAKVAQSKRCPVPKRAAIVPILRDFPEIDFDVLLSDLEHWAIHGSGSRRRLKNLASLLRNFARRAEEDRVARVARYPQAASVQSSLEGRDWNAGVLREDRDEEDGHDSRTAAHG